MVVARVGLAPGRRHEPVALIIVAYTGAVLWGPLHDGTPEGAQRAQAIMALLGPVLGAVIGYYFGASSGERIAQQATRRAEEAIEQRAEEAQLSAERLAQLEEVQPVVERSAEELAYLLAKAEAAEAEEAGNVEQRDAEDERRA